MLGMGFGEMVLIAGIALVVIGPEKFPDFAKIVVRTVSDLRGYVDDVKHDLRKELTPVKKEIDELSRYKPEDYIDALADGSGSDSDEDGYSEYQAHSETQDSPSYGTGEDQDSHDTPTPGEPQPGDSAQTEDPATPSPDDESPTAPERLDG